MPAICDHVISTPKLSSAWRQPFTSVSGLYTNNQTERRSQSFPNLPIYQCQLVSRCMRFSPDWPMLCQAKATIEATRLTDQAQSVVYSQSNLSRCAVNLYHDFSLFVACSSADEMVIRNIKRVDAKIARCCLHIELRSYMMLQTGIKT